MKFRLLALAVLPLLSVPAWADKYDDTLGLFKSMEATAPFFKAAYGYAVFPTVGKGGIGIGAAYGKGRVYRGGTRTADVALGQLSIGFQLGGQAYSELILFRNKEIYDEFMAESVEFGVDVSAVALTAGAQAGAGTSGSTASAGTSAETTTKSAGEWFRGMAVFTIARGGLMYEASLNGQTFSIKPPGSSTTAGG